MILEAIPAEMVATSRQASVMPDIPNLEGPAPFPQGQSRFHTPLGAFITLNDLPAGYVKSLGGVVCSKSVKLIEKEEKEGWDSLFF